jgi:hypothetical protein
VVKILAVRQPLSVWVDEMLAWPGNRIRENGERLNGAAWTGVLIFDLLFEINERESVVFGRFVRSD